MEEGKVVQESSSAAEESNLNPAQETVNMEQEVKNIGNETAVQTSTPNPDTTDNMSDFTSNAQQSPAETTAAPQETEPSYILDLRRVFALALLNKEFVGDRKKVEKATSALTLCNPEDRVRAQLRSHAEKTLRAKAAVEAERTGQYVAPSQADYDAYVEQGVITWRDKQPK